MHVMQLALYRVRWKWRTGNWRTEFQKVENEGSEYGGHNTVVYHRPRQTGGRYCYS